MSSIYSLLPLCPAGAGALDCPSDPAIKMSPRPILVIIFDDSEIGKIVVPRDFFYSGKTVHILIV